jgi:hypothetical protein
MASLVPSPGTPSGSPVTKDALRVHDRTLVMVTERGALLGFAILGAAPSPSPRAALQPWPLQLELQQLPTWSPQLPPQ